MNASLLPAALSRSKLLRQHLVIEPPNTFYFVKHSAVQSPAVGQAKTHSLRAGLSLAGYTSLSWNTLLNDCILVAEKLEQLGFAYYKGKVTIVEPSEEQNHV